VINVSTFNCPARQGFIGGDLLEKVEEYLNDSGSEAYGQSHMKTKLLEYFEDMIIITDINESRK